MSAREFWGDTNIQSVTASVVAEGLLKGEVPMAFRAREMEGLSWRQVGVGLHGH